MMQYHYPSSQRWFFNNRPMTSNKLLRFNGLRFNLVFKKRCLKMISREKKQEKKNQSGNIFISNYCEYVLHGIEVLNRLFRVTFFLLYRFWAFQCWPNVQFPHRICLTIQILLQKCSIDVSGMERVRWRKLWFTKELFGELKHVCLNIQLEMYEDNSISNGSSISAILSDFIHENASVCNECKARLICTFIIKCTFMNSDNLVTITTVCIFLVVELVFRLLLFRMIPTKICLYFV